MLGKKKAEKKKKHGNPGILDWIVDPKLGLFSPVTQILQTVLFDAGPRFAIPKAPDLGNWVADQYQLGTPTDAISKSLAEYIKKDVPTTLDDAVAIVKGLEEDAGARWGDTARHALITSLLPFIDLETYVILQYQNPSFRSALDIANRYLSARFNYGDEPMLQRYWFSKYTPLVPEPYRLALAASKGLLSDKVYKQAMKENGLSEEWAEMWKEESFLYPTLETGLALLRRGAITEKDFDEWMSRNGLPANVRKAVLDLKTVIPPLSDLIRFAVREAFGEHKPEEQYPTYESWAQKMGLTKEAAGWYWYAHWDRIALTQAYQNLYRGYWDKDKFMKYLRLVDIHPDDREDIYRVAWTIPSLREIGYAYDTGKWDRDQVRKMFRWMGRDPEILDDVVDSFIAYRLSAEKEAIRRELLALYSRNAINREEFEAGLRDVDTAGKVLELWLKRGDLAKQRMNIPPEEERRVITAAEAKWAYVHGLRDRGWLEEQLRRLDWDDVRIEVYLERADVERREEEERAREEVVYRRLTSAVLREAYIRGKISKEQLPGLFEQLGYSPEDARLLAQLTVERAEEALAPRLLSRTDVERMYDLRVFTEKDVSEYYKRFGYSDADVKNLTLWTKINVLFPDLRAMYRNGWITAETIVEELVKAGLDRERATELAMTVVRAERVQRIRYERDLTKSEIVKGWKKGLIDTNQAVDLLVNLGYDEWEARYILEINRVVEAGDPQGYWDMRRVIEAYKRVRGEKGMEIPEEIIMLETEIRKLREEISKKQEAGATDQEIAELAQKLGDLEYRLRQLLISKGLAKA